MELHARFKIVQAARNDLSFAIGAMIKQHDLTYGELFALMAEILSNWAKYLIRDERHPNDPDKKGDEA